MAVWLELQGPNGATPKAPKASGWQQPSYPGVDEAVALDAGLWLGLRLDDYIVVDCDNLDAAEAWLDHIGISPGTAYNKVTWVRQTPRGWHFYYRRVASNADVRTHNPGYIHDKINLKAGKGQQCVFHAPNYIDLSAKTDIINFDRAWVKYDSAKVQVPDWSEMPEGMGDNAMISFAGSFRRQGMDEATILACLQEINRITMTDEPMTTSRLKRLARSAGRYDPDTPRTVLCPKCGTDVTVV